MFINLDKELKNHTKKVLDYQDQSQKYLVYESGDRVMNEGYKQIQNKKKNKQQTCPKCGKKFLSQPALKEHCKKNHDFNPNINGEVRSRGRPRRDAVKPSDQFEQWQRQTEEQPQKPKKPSSLETFPMNCQSMEFFNKEFQKEQKIDIKQAIYDLLTSKLEQQLEEVYLIRELERFDSMIDNYYLDKNYPVSQLIAAFVVNMAQHYKDDVTKLFIIFAKSLYYYIDKYAEQDLKKIVPIDENIQLISNHGLFHDRLPIQSFPIILNKYLAFLPTFLDTFPLLYASKLLKDICDWSYQECGGFKVYYDI